MQGSASSRRLSSSARWNLAIALMDHPPWSARPALVYPVSANSMPRCLGSQQALEEHPGPKETVP